MFSESATAQVLLPAETMEAAMGDRFAREREV